MSLEIERKFLIEKMPNLDGLTPVIYERYFMFTNNSIEIRIQKKGEKYELERKERNTDLTASKQKIEITKDEYLCLKTSCSGISILRESYLLSKNPEISLKVYKGNLEGLKRVEVEFGDENEAKKFVPLDWFGKEITHDPLGKDANLLNLTREDVMVMLRSK